MLMLWKAKGMVRAVMTMEAIDSFFLNPSVRVSRGYGVHGWLSRRRRDFNLSCYARHRGYALVFFAGFTLLLAT